MDHWWISLQFLTRPSSCPLLHKNETTPSKQLWNLHFSIPYNLPSSALTSKLTLVLTARDLLITSSSSRIFFSVFNSTVIRKLSRSEVKAKCRKM